MKRFLKLVYNCIPFKKYIFLVVKSFIRLSPSTYQHLHFKGSFKVKIDPQHGFLMRHYGYLVENEIFWGGLYNNSWEARSLKYWTELCRDASCIIDAGANTGIYSLIAREMNKEAKVIAFEPLAGVSAMLNKNIQLNNFDILTVQKALSDRDGEAVIYDDLYSDHSYAATVNVNLRPDNSKVAGSKVTTVRLETFIEEQGIKKIDLMKIDVETHEPELLEGFGKYLREFEPTMLIEILNDEIGMKIHEMIKTIPYLYYNINETTGARRADSLTKSEGYNFLICKKEIAVKLGLEA